MAHRGLVVVFLLAMAGACSGTGDAPSRSACLEMRAHAVDLQLEAAGGARLPADELTAHRRARLGGDEHAYVARCQSAYAGGDVDCARRATTLDTYRACLGGK